EALEILRRMSRGRMLAKWLGRAGHRRVRDSEMARRATIDAVLEVRNPDLLNGDRPRRIRLTRFHARRARHTDALILALNGAVRPQRVLDRRERKHGQEGQTGYGEKASQRHVGPHSASGNLVPRPDPR